MDNWHFSTSIPLIPIGLLFRSVNEAVFYILCVQYYWSDQAGALEFVSSGKNKTEIAVFAE